MSPFRILRPAGASPFVLLCDHASNFVPDEFHCLGLPHHELNRHIAWDIGAAGVTEVLSELLDAPAILCNTSRLVVDCNRQLHAPGLIPEVSDGTVIPGNLTLSEAARQDRLRRWFHPYHRAIEDIIEGRPTLIAVSIHSMTPSLGGQHRPWQIAFSSYASNRSLSDRLIEELRRPGDITVGDNQPYDLDPEVDYSVPAHALSRHLPYVQVEFRQDEVTLAAQQISWAERFAQALVSLSLS